MENGLSRLLAARNFGISAEFNQPEIFEHKVLKVGSSVGNGVKASLDSPQKC